MGTCVEGTIWGTVVSDPGSGQSGPSVCVLGGLELGMKATKREEFAGVEVGVPGGPDALGPYGEWENIPLL